MQEGHQSHCHFESPTPGPLSYTSRADLESQVVPLPHQPQTHQHHIQSLNWKVVHHDQRAMRTSGVVFQPTVNAPLTSCNATAAMVGAETTPLHTTHLNACFTFFMKVTSPCIVDTPLAISFSFWWMSGVLQFKNGFLLDGNDASDSSLLSSCVKSMLALPGSVLCPVSFLYNSQEVASTFHVDFQKPPEVHSFPRRGQHLESSSITLRQHIPCCTQIWVWYA